MGIPKKEGILRSDIDNAREHDLAEGRFLITSAVAGATVHGPLLRTMRTYCKKADARLRILPMRAHQNPMQRQPGFYDTALYPYMERGYVLASLTFNGNLKAMDLQLNPQQIQPLTGVTRLGRSSLIVAHPVLEMKVLAHSNDGLPRMVHTTGAITQQRYQANRVGVLASQSHRLGGLIVELAGSRFHMRQLQADSDGSVVDLGVRYNADGSKEAERAESLVLGDIHAGQHDLKAMKAWKELARKTKPKYIFLHDLFNGLSINHHMEHDQLAKVMLPEHLNTLAKELAVTRDVLAEIASWVPDAKVVVVASNHNDWLYHYLTENKWTRDKTNYWTAYELIGAVRAGRNPLQAAVDPAGRCTWLGRDDDFILHGVQHGCHGDKGANGSKGSQGSLETTYGAITYGHVHTPGILRDAWAVGTTSLLKQGWNGGASGWLHTSCLMYASRGGGVGLRQLVTALEGEWRV